MRKARSLIRKLGITILILVGLYAVLGFVVVPLVVRHAVFPRLGEAIGRDVRSGSVRFNPFLLKARVREFEVAEPDGQQWIGFEELLADVEATSLARGLIRVRDFRLTRPSVLLARDEAGRFNFADIVGRFAGKESPPPDPDAKPPRFYIENAEIIDGRIEFKDASVSPAVEATIQPISFSIGEFGTVEQADNRIVFSAARDAGFEFSWEGDFDLTTLEGGGTARLTGLRLGSFDGYADEYISFHIVDTVIDFELPIEIRAIEPLNPLGIHGGTFVLRDIRFATGRETREGFFEIGRFAINGIDLEPGSTEVTVDEIIVDEGDILLRRDEKGIINLTQLAEPDDAASEPDDGTEAGNGATPGEETPDAGTGPGDAGPAEPEVEPAEAAPAWVFTADRFETRGISIRVEDRKTGAPVDFVLRVESAEIVPVTTDAEIPMAVSVRCGVAEEGVLTVKGQVQPAKPAGEFSFEAASIPLPLPKAYIEEILYAVVEEGRLDADGTVTFGGGDGGGFRLEGNLGIDGLRVVDERRDGGLIEWEEFSATEILIDGATSEIDIGRLEIVGPAVDLVLAADGGLNLATLARGSESGEGDPGTAGAPAGEEWTIQCPTFELQDGTVRFVNEGLEPPTATVITDLSVSINGFTTAGDDPTGVVIAGRIAPFGDVEIDGSLFPTDPARETELLVKAAGIDLTSLSPYAIPAIGYGLDGGTLELDLGYTVRDNALEGKNEIVIHHLALGKKSSDPDAPDLPIKAAMAVLEDRHGRVRLDVPISGSLSDPGFRIRDVLVQAIHKPIMKIATSPLAVLEATFGGDADQDLSIVAFAPGTTRPDPGDRAKLDAIGRAMADRPAVAMEIAGYADPAVDKGPLARAELDAILVTYQDRHPDLPAGSIELEDVRAAVVEAAWRDVTSGGSLPEPGPAVEPTEPTEPAEPEGASPEPAAPAQTSEEIVPTAATPDEPPTDDAGERDAAAETPPTEVAPAAAQPVALPRGRTVRHSFFGGPRREPARPESPPPAEEPETAPTSPDGAEEVAGTKAEAAMAGVTSMERDLLRQITIDDDAIRDLARQRADAVLDFLRTTHEIDPSRVTPIPEFEGEGPVAGVRFRIKN